MLKHNQHHQITFSMHLSDCYNTCTAAKQNKVNDVRVKRPTITNTDHHNGDSNIPVFPFSNCATIRCLQ